jgi:D-alanine-D-alanine ligase-like ATP-grasp enzyme
MKNNCFEVYGFDVMIDKDFKPWIIEVNVLPSLSSSSFMDKSIKTTLMGDTLTLIGMN